MNNMCMHGKCGDMTKKCCSKSIGLLLIRLSVAVVFLYTGISKLSDMPGTIGFFNHVGIPAFFAWVVAIVETLGGIAMLLGAWTCVFGILLAVVMFFSIILVKAKMGFSAMEIDVAMLAASLGIMFTGPGKYALNWCCKSCMAKNTEGSCGMDGKCGGDMKCDKCETMCKDGKCNGHEMGDMKCDMCETSCKDGKCNGHEKSSMKCDKCETMCKDGKCNGHEVK